MYRRTLAQLGLFSAFVEEIRKLPAYFSYKAQQGAEIYVDAASDTVNFLKGEDPNETPEMREKRRQHKEMYNAVLNEQAAKAAAEQAKVAQANAHLSWKARLQRKVQEAKEAVTQMTSTKAGVMALLQHCTASHAAEIALEQGIDVKNVQMVFEKAATTSAVGQEEVVVGYIDAPAASREEVMAFAERLHKACPVANSMHIDWRPGRPDNKEWDAGKVRRAEDLQESMDQATTQMEWTESRSGASSTPQQRQASAEAAIPAGTPGARTVPAQRPTPSSSGSSSSSSALNPGLRDDDEELHLPGIKK